MIFNTSSTSPAATFGASFGYAFDGDQVDLNAEVLLHDPSSPATLQLWASATPYEGVAQAGFKIAEVPVGDAHGAGFLYVNATVAAIPPAGIGDHAMVLVLAGVDGIPLDFANFPRRESFLLPRLGGELGYRLDGERLNLTAGVIANPRSGGNVSGSLRLELWALAESYDGGDFSGASLGFAEVGQVFGESTLVGCQYDVPLSLPPEGTWQLVLMLSEWTGQRYVTRDYSNFQTQVSFPLQAVEAEVEAAATLEDARAVNEEPGHAAVQQCSTPEPKKAAKRASAAKAVKTSKAPKAEAALPSVNSAELADLHDVKGLSKTVAAAIVAKRPFIALDELLKVKGIGAKLLEKLRTRVTL